MSRSQDSIASHDKGVENLYASTKQIAISFELLVSALELAEWKVARLEEEVARLTAGD